MPAINSVHSLISLHFPISFEKIQVKHFNQIEGKMILIYSMKYQ